MSYSTRLAWGPEFDFIIAGDSRSFTDLSPAIITHNTRFKRGGVFAFSANKFSHEYLSAIERLLVPNNPANCVLLGFNPHNLSHHPDDNFGYLFERSRHPTDLWIERNLGFLTPFRETFRLTDISRIWNPGEYPHALVWHSDGWGEAFWVVDSPFDDPAHLEAWANDPTARQVSDLSVNAVLDFTKKQVAVGVIVCGFFPPLPDAVRAAEEKRHGFKPGPFVERFEAAGGVWLDVPLENAKYSDHTHLLSESARRYSNNMRQAILNQFPQWNQEPAIQD